MPGAENEQTATRPRYRVSGGRRIAVVIHGATGSETPEIEAQLVELSADGARLAAPVPLEVHDQIQLSLGEEIGLSEPIAAEVRWSRREHRNGFLAGCEFACQLPDELLDELLADGILDEREPARHGVSGEADGFKELNPTALHVRLVDLSRGGLSVVSPQPAKIGQRLRLVFQEANHEPVEILSRIRWQGETQEGFLLGCQFEHDEYYYRLRDLVCPGENRGTNGKDRRSSKRVSCDGRLGWLKRLWKQEEEDLVVSASLMDLRALTASAQGDAAMSVPDSQESLRSGGSLDGSKPIPCDHSDAATRCEPESSPREQPSHDAVATGSLERGEPAIGSDDDAPTDEYAAFERRFRELQALASQVTEDPFRAPPEEEPSLDEPVPPESVDTSADGVATSLPAAASDDENALSRSGPNRRLESEPTEDQSAERFDDATQGYGGSAPLETRVLSPTGPVRDEASEQAALEKLLSETETLRTRQEQFAAELQRCEDRLERLGRQFAQQQQLGPQRQAKPAAPTIKRARQRRRRSPVWLGLRLFVLLVIAAVCWSWFVPGPLSKLLNVSDWRSLLGPRFGTPTVTGDDGYTVEEDGTLTVPAPGVFGNDRTGAGRNRAVLVRAPEHGTLQLGEDGSFQYTPHADFHGTDSFTYKGEDRADDRAASTVQITVTPVNDAPVAAPDAYTIGEDQTLSVDASGVLANDTDADGDNLSAVLVGEPEHGTVSLKSDGTFEYTPNQDFAGTDHFTYAAGDVTAQSEAATVTITVEPANDAPSATPDSFSTMEGAPLRVAAPGVLSNDRDVEGDPLTAHVARGPEHGTLTLSPDGSFQYMPEAGFSGEDGFTYEVRDASSAATGTVTIRVARKNDAPTSKGIRDVTNPDTKVPLSIDLSQVFQDPDGDPLTYTVVGNDQPDWVAATIADSHTLQLHFAGPTSGMAEIRVRATDPAGEFAEETVRVNNAPRANPAIPPTQAADEQLAALTAAIERDSQDAQLWKARARRNGELRRWQAAADDYREAVARDPRDRGAWSDRGGADAELGQWQQAQFDFAQAIAIEPDAPDTAYVMYLEALAALGGNDLDAYRTLCAQSLTRIRRRADATNTVWVAWTLALAPEATEDFTGLIDRTGATALGNSGNTFAAIALGALYYRTGRFDRALEQFERTAARPTGSGPLPYDWYLLAMTYERLGRRGEAAQWLQRATNVTDQLLSGERTGGPLPWNRSLTLQLLRREAEAAIAAP